MASEVPTKVDASPSDPTPAPNVEDTPVAVSTGQQRILVDLEAVQRMFPDLSEASSAILKAVGSPKGSEAVPVVKEAVAPKEDAAGTYFIRLRGLPWESSVNDILNFIKPVIAEGEGAVPNFGSENVKMLVTPQGKCSGEAYVQLPNSELRDKCIRQLHGQLLGRRWIEVFRSSALEMREAEKRNTMGGGGGGGIPGGGGSADLLMLNSPRCVRLRGLPWGCSETDIVQWFAEGGFTIDVLNVCLPLGRGARSSGEAWVDMGSVLRAEDARRDLHRKTLGTRYIEVFPATQKEMLVAQRGWPGTAGGASGSDGGYGRAAGGNRRRFDDFSSPFLESAPYARAAGPAPTAGASSATGSYSGSGRASPFMVMDPNRSCVTVNHAGVDLRPFVPSASSSSTSYGQPAAATAPSRHDPYGFTVLRLRGLPYGSNENHIVQFFSGFSMITILPSTVPIDGRPSGEAYVEFISADEAMRAYQMRQGARIEHRYIELFPASKQEMNLAAAGMDTREIRMRLGH